MSSSGASSVSGPASAAVVVPTHRRERVSRFLDAWKDEFAGHDVIVVEDNPERSFDLGRCGVEHYSWKEIDKELGADSWIIPRGTDCVRSFGFYKAWHRQVDLVISLDDDCLPIQSAARDKPGFVAMHWEMLSASASSPAWVSTIEGGTPRGVPYLAKDRACECVLNHGLWQGVPDFDAITQLHSGRQPLGVKLLDQIIPRGMYFPMCGMNLAFKAELAPAMYFLLMGRDWPYDRFGDIWCGIFAKRICDHLGWAVRSGQPFVHHERASGVWANLRKEAPAYEVNEKLWQIVDRATLTETTAAGCYRELADQLTLPGEYWARLREAMHIWAGLFARADRPRPVHAVAAEATRA